MKIVFYLLFGFILFTSLTNVVYSQQAIIPKSKNGFVVIAHRGNHVAAQENTLAVLWLLFKMQSTSEQIMLK